MSAASMEHLFMQVFERKGWVEAQLRQQVDSYGQSLAYNLLAAGRRPPPWLLPAPAAGDAPLCDEPGELNGKPIISDLLFPRSQITTSASHSTVFQPPALPSISFSDIGVSDQYIHPESNSEAMDTSRLEESHQEQAFVNQEFAETYAEVDTFSRIQRSRSRQRDIEDRLCEKVQKSSDGTQNGMWRSRLATMRSDRTTEASSSELFPDGGNNWQTTASRLKQKDDRNANQVMSTESLKCSEDGGRNPQETQTDSFPSTSVALENQNLNCENHIMNPANCSAGNVLREPLVDHSKLKNADNVRCPLPETTLLVEPKKLQFDGFELSSFNPVSASEGTNQRQKCGSEIALPELMGTQSLNGDPASTNSLEGPRFIVSPLLEKDKLHIVEEMRGIREIGSFSDRSIDGSSKFLEQQNSESHSLPPPCNEPSLLPTRSAHTTSRASASLGMLLENAFEDHGCKLSSHAQIDGATNRCSQAGFGAKSKQLLPQTINEVDVNRHSLTCSRRETNGSDAENAAINSDALVSAENELYWEQYKRAYVSSTNVQHHEKDGLQALRISGVMSEYLADISETFEKADHHDNTRRKLSDNISFDVMVTPSLELDRNYASMNAPIVSSALCTPNESFKGKAVLDSVKCHSKQLGGVQVGFSVLTEANDISVRSNKGEPAAPKVASTISAKSTRMLHTAETNSMTSADQCPGSLQYAGTEQEICGFETAIETNVNSCTLQTDKGTKSSRPSVRYILRSSGSREMNISLMLEGGSAASDRKRSIASEVHVNGNSWSKRRKMNCKSDVIVSNSLSTRSSSSLNFEVGGSGRQMKTAENFSGKAQPSVRYFLWSSGSHDSTSLNSEGRSAASDRKRSNASEVHANGNSCPKRRKINHLSDVALCYSPRTETASLSHHGGRSSQRVTAANVSHNSQPHSLQNNLDTVTAAAFSHSCSNILSDSKEQCRTKGSPCLKDEGQDAPTVRVEHDELALQMGDMDYGTVMMNMENYCGSISSTSNPLPESYAFDQLCQQPSDWNTSILEKLSSGCSVERTEKGIHDDSKGQSVYDAATSLQNDDDSVDCDETMPELESFSIAVPSNSQTIEERAFEAFCNSRKLVTLSSNLSMKYKIHTLSDVYQSLPTRFQNLMNRSSLNADEIKQCSASYGSNFLGLSGACRLELDSSFLMSDVLTSGSSNASTGQEKSEIPLTPSVEKYSQGKLSGRAGASSEPMGSNPELTCFRIDEDSSIAEENDNQDRLPGSVERNFSNQWSTGRTGLQDVTALYQNIGTFASDSIKFLDRGSLDSMNKVSEVEHHSNLRNDHASKKPKENRVPSVKREGKVSQFLHDRLSRTEILGNKSERNRSEANLERVCKPSNIVANMTSFIPLVKQKQQSTTANLKKDVRVKALEAAEAAKRLEEKKQNDREMRKAAAKLERERLKQEKEAKQKKDEEQKKKREADIATRKRQREEEEKKEKERKRKCIEEARKQQKQPVERMRSTNEEKDACRKAFDDKELRKNLVEGVKSQFKSDGRKESVLGCKGVEINNVRGVVADEKSARLELQVQENLSNNVEKSYEMSPYKDSDEEDDDAMEHEEELRRRRKSIPSWARKEFLDKILLSNQTLDPREIFARKCSFNLTEVLLPHIPQRRLK